MASIFTYEPEPLRVASPWLGDSGLQAPSNDPTGDENFRAQELLVDGSAENGAGISRLQPEPQEGPVEYKLHLLLRPRRKFQSTSTANKISGSKQSKPLRGPAGRSVAESTIDAAASSGVETPPSSSTQQTRQHRLQQLTTQLLWRLQQSSPHHTSSASNLILPSLPLPEALPELQLPQRPAKLLHGLEESQGALYEIGVSDDGALIGLADDEMEESLNNLKAMAACLGCEVEILRRESVGRCEWLESAAVSDEVQQIRRDSRLSVVEALVKPSLHSKAPSSPSEDVPTSIRSSGETEQLRVTLTGPTMSGKSTLLGTLTTSTLDNGRGTSRLSMLKHRHEINSGMTSSVSQELLGYNDQSGGDVEVLNYDTENIASWIDVHAAASGSRLVLITDSAGHPRYRRTTVRGLIGCAPHWTLMCFPADDTEDFTTKPGSTSTTQQSLGSTVSDVDLSAVQLDLCLRLRLPLVIVITKLDLASRSGLKASLTKVLDALKAAGRKPAIMPNANGEMAELGMDSIPASSIEIAYRTVLPLLNDPIATVPIILTSAVQGSGIGNLHALLHELPVPHWRTTSPHNIGPIFHIEDTFRKPAEVDGIILSGILRHFSIKVGDKGFVGPFATGDVEESEDSEDRPHRSSNSLPTSRSFPGALRDSHLTPPRFQLPDQEWRRCKVVSVRNLRLPVHALLPDQAGTLAIAPYEHGRGRETSTPFGRIRKGMVFTTIQPFAARSFVAEFKREDLESLAVGNHVVVYTASVRASARVVSARAPDSPRKSSIDTIDEPSSEASLTLDTQRISDEETSTEDRVAGAITARNLLVTFSLNASKEFLVVNDQVLVMPGGGPGLYVAQERGEKGMAGLDGFVGIISEIFA